MQHPNVLSQGGYPIGRPEPDRSYWATKMHNGTWHCEMDTVSNAHGGSRLLDWTLDIVATGDITRVAELWLCCPQTPTSPAGNVARLPITQQGTAFQFKVATMDSNIASSLRSVQAQITGRVTNSKTGDCECFVYDYAYECLVALWKSNVYSMGTWRPTIAGTPSIAPIGRLSFRVQGLQLAENAS